MKTIMLLCDYAEVVNGKLYIMGGGWTACPPGPRPMSIAIRILVPWDEANVKHKLELFLQDSDGKTIEVGDPPTPFVQMFEFEVGRPPGAPHGTDLEFAHAFGFFGLPVEPDKRFRWQLELNGDPVADAPFYIAGSAGGFSVKR